MKNKKPIFKLRKINLNIDNDAEEKCTKKNKNQKFNLFDYSFAKKK